MKEHDFNHDEYYVWRVNVLTKLLDLHSCIDFDKGKDVAYDLGQLYGYIMKNLVKDDSGEQTQEFIDLLSTVLEGWKTISIEVVS